MNLEVVVNPTRSLKILHLSPLRRREALLGYAYISPWVIGFLIFTLFPMVATLVFTFTNISLSDDPVKFVGLDNYTTLFKDAQVWKSLAVTLKFALISLPVALIVPFSVAMLMNSKHLRGSTVYRTLFYMPYVIPFVAAIFAWSGMLNAETGWINQVLRALGVQDPPNWLNDISWIYPALVIMGLWGIGSSMLINLAGLQGIPTELFDAAQVDGAGWWAQLGNVTLPLMSPVIFYTLTLELVGVFQYFLVPLVLSNGTGDPGGATMFYNLYLYKEFFTFQNMSYGATMAWLLFIVILAVTLVLFWSQKYWVYYAGETREA